MVSGAVDPFHRWNLAVEAVLADQSRKQNLAVEAAVAVVGAEVAAAGVAAGSCFLYRVRSCFQY